MQTPNGILPVDKPAGWTSFDVLAKLRGALGTRKLGHSGTLDPMATGVLAVFIGKATSAADRQLDHDKTYEATIRLGLRTDTGDVTGTTLETAPVTVEEREPRPTNTPSASPAPRAPTSVCWPRRSAMPSACPLRCPLCAARRPVCSVWPSATRCRKF